MTNNRETLDQRRVQRSIMTIKVFLSLEICSMRDDLLFGQNVYLCVNKKVEKNYDAMLQKLIKK